MRGEIADGQPFSRLVGKQTFMRRYMPEHFRIALEAIIGRAIMKDDAAKKVQQPAARRAPSSSARRIFRVWEKDIFVDAHEKRPDIELKIPCRALHAQGGFAHEKLQNVLRGVCFPCLCAMRGNHG